MARIFWSGVFVAVMTASFLGVDLIFGLGLQYFWVDLVEHFLGGVLAGLIGVWWALALLNRAHVIHAIMGALVLGIAVEVLEYAFGWGISVFMSQNLDTFKDIIIDVIGGWAIWHFAKRWV